MTNSNGRIRVEFSMPWYMRLTSLPFLAGGLYFTTTQGRSCGRICLATAIGATTGSVS